MHKNALLTVPLHIENTRKTAHCTHKNFIAMKKLQYILTALWLILTGCLGQTMAETATGVTVSGAVKFTNDGTTVETGIEGTVYLLSADGTEAYSGKVETMNISGKYVSGYSIADVAAGTYTLSFEGKSIVGQGQTKALVFTQSITVADQALTQDIAATADDTRGWMEFKVKKKDCFNSCAISNAEVTCQKVGETAVKKVKTDYNGIAAFLVSKDAASRYNITIKSPIYVDETKNDLPYSATLREIEMTPRPVVNVKLTGTVTVSGVDARQLNSLGFVVGLTDFMGNTHQAPAFKADGSYTFEEVPAGPATLYLHDADNGDAQNRSYKYGIKTPAGGEFTISTEAVNTQNIEVEKIASKVSGTVKGLIPSFGDQAKITLTKTGTTAVAYETIVMVEGTEGRYTFPGVTAGTYAVAFVCPGYGVKGTIANVEVALTADATIPEIEVETVPLTVTFTGSAQATNDKNVLVSFKDAKVELWSYNTATATEGEKLEETTTDQHGGFTLSHQMKLQDGYRIKITHNEIRPNQATAQVRSQSEAVRWDKAIEFADAVQIPWQSMKNFAAKWNATSDTMLLSWTWPDSLRNPYFSISSLKLYRRMAGSATKIELKQWEASSGFDFANLPKLHKDTIKGNATSCTYIFEINYFKPSAHTLDVSFEADLTKKPSYQLSCNADNAAAGYIVRGSGTEPYTGGRYYEDEVINLTAIAKTGYLFKAWVSTYNGVQDTVGRMVGLSVKMGAHDTTLTALFLRDETVKLEYTLTLTANNPAFGEVSGGGTYEENTEVTAKATPKAGHRFKEWQENGLVVVNAGPEYTFTITSDRALTAIFEQEVANEDEQAAAWSVFAERDGVLVIDGLQGDQYMVYDLNGRLAARANNTGSEVRINLRSNQLYMVRRLSANGQFDVKKIVLR